MAKHGKRDELGAHVSAAGGVDLAPARAAAIPASVLQLFTKTPAQWADPLLDEATVSAFRSERERCGIVVAASHDSYLINLATSDRRLHRKSVHAFDTELERSERLGLEYVVTHPGHATDGRIDHAIERNACAVADALARTAGRIAVLFETTAGTGNALGSSFEELARLIVLIPSPVRPRVGVCLDTCHVWAAGYDLRRDYDGVFNRFDDAIGLDRLRFFHLNDSVGALGSRRDRHANIGKGQLGREPFERLVNDSRFLHVPKVIETPKEKKKPLAADRANLRRLRGWRR